MLIFFAYFGARIAPRADIQLAECEAGMIEFLEEGDDAVARQATMDDDRGVPLIVDFVNQYVLDAGEVARKPLLPHLGRGRDLSDDAGEFGLVVGHCASFRVAPFEIINLPPIVRRVNLFFHS